jgi:hypothetical protein
MVVSEVQQVVIDSIVNNKLRVGRFACVFEFGDHVTIDVGDIVSVRLYEWGIRVSDYRTFNDNIIKFEYCQFDKLLEYVNEIV